MQEDFVAFFGRAPHTAASAPGRVNLMGEHTDYNEGFVLPMPIPQRTTVELDLRHDELVRLVSTDVTQDMMSYSLGRETPTGAWIDYVQGVTKVLAERGHTLRGFDARVSSRVPVGAGLSSSAALEVALLRALDNALGLGLGDLEIARVGQAAEVTFVGAPVGIMDQMAASVGRPGHALFLDTRTLMARDVPVPVELELIVIASGLTHAHGTGGYRERRAECNDATARLGIRALRDLGPNDRTRIDALPSPLDRRVRHIVSENQRVHDTVEAMERGDFVRLGELFAASHASMRDDFEVSLPEIDTLVRLGAEHPDVVGARLTGGGFGGSVVMLAHAGKAHAAADAIAKRYATETQKQPTVLLPA